MALTYRKVRLPQSRDWADNRGVSNRNVRRVVRAPNDPRNPVRTSREKLTIDAWLHRVRKFFGKI